MMGTRRHMADYSTVGIWTRCPSCADEAVAVVQFWGRRGDTRARLVDFRCGTGGWVDAGAVLAAPNGPGRPVQRVEFAIDALDIAAIRPFWKAVLDYVDEPGGAPDGPLIDPAEQLPSLWFQQMDARRPQRNRIHLDLDVAHD